MPNITFNSYVIEFILFLQVSSDGPNVNLHFTEIVKEKRKDANLKPLLVYTLGYTLKGYTLSIMLSSMEQKLVDGQIDKVLSSMCKIFDQSPSRRGDYEKLTRGIYPLRFYSHRWIENKLVAERAIEVWDDIVIDVKFWMSLPKSKQPSSDNKSYTQLKKAITDLLIKMKFKFFCSIC